MFILFPRFITSESVPRPRSRRAASLAAVTFPHKLAEDFPFRMREPSPSQFRPDKVSLHPSFHAGSPAIRGLWWRRRLLPLRGHVQVHSAVMVFSKFPMKVVQ